MRHRAPVVALAASRPRSRDTSLLGARAGKTVLPCVVAFGQLDEAMLRFDPAVNVLPTPALHGLAAIVAFPPAKAASRIDCFPLPHVPASPRADSTPLEWARLPEQLQISAFLQRWLK